ncbi:uncharacterized protein LOC105426156 isoform X2 [Pogonomyrmex barbatus]|uniref:Uncharacterized protein LOC105426156 isoform X2 n=1 Tax=Pogonomyrmex barbatus TaxID=144034 RepID=A0A6I9W2W6_9HYME|nr:uncharacterized protein LOC105426156 isoform X2 [Pogonomyrmex barbatus]
METRYDAMRCDATRRDATRCDAMRLVLDSQHSQRACCLLHDSGAGVPVCHDYGINIAVNQSIVNKEITCSWLHYERFTWQEHVILIRYCFHASSRIL